MTGTAFTAQHSSAWLYYALRGESARGEIDRRLAYVPPVDETPPIDMSLSQTWATGGVYLFLGRRPNSDQSFLSSFRAWQEASAPKGLRLLWLEDPNAAPATWCPSIVRISKPTEQGAVIAAPARIALRNYAVVLARGCRIALDEEAPGFVLGPPEGSQGEAYLTVDRAHSPLRGPAPRFPLLTPGARLSLRGPQAGAIAFRVEIAAPTNDRAPVSFEALDVANRYFYPAPGEPAGTLASLRYPIFDLRAQAISLAAVWDPSDPLGERTAFSIEPGDSPLSTYFRTSVGGRIDLKPLADASLRFEIRPGKPDPKADQGTIPLYLVPAGSFEIVLPEAPEGGRQLLCGTCAAEYVELETAGAVLRFVPHQPAFAPLFEPSERETGGEAVDAPRLDPAARTSWVSLSAPAPLVYYAQPAAAVFYARATTQPDDMLLSFFPVPAGRLPAGGADQGLPSDSFPLVPYAGIDAEIAKSAMALEREVLSQERRQIIYELTARLETPVLRAEPLASGETLTAVTPVGFVARFSKDKEIWESLNLARMGEHALALQNVVDPLRSALLTNEQFLVISDPTVFGRYFRDNHRLEIQDWVFDLDPEQWERHGTIVVIKNCDRSLADLVDDVGTWVLAEEFNRSPDLTQRELERIIADAKERHDSATGQDGDGASASSYDYFVQTVVDDPTWNGVLFLNCLVPPAELPEELRDLAPGLDEERFFAHHLGINQTVVTSESLSSDSTGNSSLFGLIAYTDSLRPPGSGSSSYDFQVLEIEVLFANSAIRHFSSSIAVTLMRLFGARATAVGSDTGNALVLDGSYQRRGDRSVYAYRNRRQVVFDLEDRILRRVKLDRAEFGSLTQPPGVDAPDENDAMMVSCFSFQGSLAFEQMRDRTGGVVFDLFSYDDLAFSKLALEMRYRRDAPTAVSFRLDASGVAFDGASARDDSLASHFPVRPVSMIAHGEAAQPTGLGYMTVGVPGLDVARLGSEWFGIVFDLDLGTPGALAGAVGFKASLALVWSPSRSADAVFVGLKMPGSSGGSNELSLMGILKLTIYQLQLLQADEAFILKLTGMTLKLMGKTLPPGATFDFFLFGDPDAVGGSTSLGWYGAFKRPAEEAEAEEPELLRAPRQLPEPHPWSRTLLVDKRRDRPPR